MEIEARHHLAYTNLAWIEWEEGNAARARQAARHALHLRPGFEPARRVLAAIEANGSARRSQAAYVFHDLIELFGEITTAEFRNE